MDLVVEGLTNKEVADKLAISEVTTKMHRGQVMRLFLLSELCSDSSWSDLCDKKFEFDFPSTLRENSRQAISSAKYLLSSTPKRGFLRHDAVPTS